MRLIWTIRFIHYVQYALKFSFTSSTEIFKTVFSLRSLRLYGPENFVNKNCQKLFCRFFLSKIKFVNICHHKNIIIISLLYSEFYSEFYSELSSDLSSDLFSVLLLFIFYAISVVIILYLYKKVSLVVELLDTFLF